MRLCTDKKEAVYWCDSSCRSDYASLSHKRCFTCTKSVNLTSIGTLTGIDDLLGQLNRHAKTHDRLWHFCTVWTNSSSCHSLVTNSYLPSDSDGLVVEDRPLPPPILLGEVSSSFQFKNKRQRNSHKTEIYLESQKCYLIVNLCPFS